MGKDIRNVFHQLLLALEIIEAKQSKVLIDGKQYLPMDLRNEVIPNEFDIGHQRNVNPLGNVDSLEELIVPFLLVEIIVNDVLVEHGLLNEH